MMESPEQAKAREWIYTVRTLHRGKRSAGFAGCALGAGMMLWGRFSPEQAPTWAIAAGLVLVLGSWALFAFVAFARWKWVKTHPFPDLPGADIDPRA